MLPHFWSRCWLRASGSKGTGSGGRGLVGSCQSPLLAPAAPSSKGLCQASMCDSRNAHACAHALAAGAHTHGTPSLSAVPSSPHGSGCGHETTKTLNTGTEQGSKTVPSRTIHVWAATDNVVPIPHFPGPSGLPLLVYLCPHQRSPWGFPGITVSLGISRSLLTSPALVLPLCS